MTTEPTPQRLSDAERDEAVTMLREHFEEGRLDQSEFTERMEAALAARFAADLTPLFVDLPDPRPLGAGLWQASYPVPFEQTYPAVPDAAGDDLARRDNTQRVLSVVQAVVWPVAILLLLTGGGIEWIFIALIVSVILRSLPSGRRRPPPYLEQ